MSICYAAVGSHSYTKALQIVIVYSRVGYYFGEQNPSGHISEMSMGHSTQCLYPRFFQK